MTTPITGLGPAGGLSPHDKLREAARQLESVFYGQLLQAMRATVPEGGSLDHSNGEQMFTAMLDDRIAQLAAGQTDRGLATAMYRQLSRQLPEEAAVVPPTSTPNGKGE